MLCDICGKNSATVHLTEIIDNQMNELHLCEECARQKNAEMEHKFGSDLLAGMAETEKFAKEKETVSVICPNCGLSYTNFKKIGRLGCGECYIAFKKYLILLLKRIHGSAQHVGKVPRKTGVALKKKTLLQDLGDKLQAAIKVEDFEEAARIRDRIREIERKKQNIERIA